MTGLQQRQLEPELMDDPALDARAHAAALRGLARINRWSGAAGSIWKGVRERLRPGRLRILDVACGSGDVTLALHRLAARAGHEVETTGWDISPEAVNRARERADAEHVPVTFEVADALASDAGPDFDLVVTSLFLHHLDNDDAQRLLARMAALSRGCVAIDDLIRGPGGYLLASTAPRVLTRSCVVHTDARLSVRAAFTPAEAERLAAAAGLRDVEVRRHWPARFLLTARGAR
jgi:2-polyprenyl-3-methyl-5-hydroxy-6-metoxy-1,4-benzoquinol methylase